MDDRIEEIHINFSNEEMAQIFEELKVWIQDLRKYNYNLEAITEVMCTFALIYAYTYADIGTVDDSIQEIKNTVTLNLVDMPEGEREEPVH